MWWPFLTRLGTSVVPLLPPVLIFLLGWQSGAGGHTVYAHIWRKADLLFIVFDNYQRAFDVIGFLLFLSLFVLPAYYRRLRIAPELILPLAAVFALYLLMPSEMYTGAGADHRIPQALFMLLIAATQPARLSARMARYLAIVPALLFLIRTGVVEQVWHHADIAYEADLAALDMMPVGGRLAVAQAADAVAVTAAPTLHLPTLAIWRRDAFVPTLFAFPAQQPVRLTPRWAALATKTSSTDLWSVGLGRNKITPALAGVLGQYDYVAFVDCRPVTARHDPMLREVGGTGGFRLYRIVSGSGEGAPVSTGKSSAPPHSAQEPS